MKRNNTILIFIFSTIATIVAIGSFIFFFNIIKNKNQQISVMLITLQEKLKEKENAIIFTEKINEIKLLQESINSRFVDPNKIDIFVGYLEDLGLSIGSDISIKNIEVPINIKNTISFKLSILGTFQQIMKTITILENIPYQVNISQAYLNKEMKQPVEIKLPTDTKQPTERVIINNTDSDILKWQADVYFNILSLD